MFFGKLNDVKKKAVHPYTAAVILAAGEGSRFSDVPGQKQHVKIGDIPVLARTLLIFDSSSYVDEIVVVVRKGEENIVEKYIGQYGIKKVSSVTEGGDTRAESSLLGVESVSEKVKFVLVHDGARCLVTDENIKSVCRAAYKHGAAVAAQMSKDTVKLSDGKGFVKNTLDRNDVWLVKTPQVFKYNMYLCGAYTVKRDNIAVTDDASMVEYAGFRVRLVDCGDENIKITTPEDAVIAGGILSGRNPL